MKISNVLDKIINEATFSKGYNDPEREYDYDTGKDEISDAGKMGKQQNVRYETDPNGENKFKVVFYHPARTDDGENYQIPAEDITKKYGKEFVTYRQANKYLNSPLVTKILKQYNKNNKSDRGYHNDISSVLHDPYTYLLADIKQINLSQQGQYDKEADEWESRF